MPEIRRGVNRTVLLIGPWAIKVPSFRNGSRYFVYGMLGNLLERDHWRMSHHPRLAPVLACGPLGLLLVMERLPFVLDRALTPDELRQFPFLNLDNNGDNVGIGPHGLTLFDYGNPGVYLAVEGEI
jgi:hypothetical protein